MTTQHATAPVAPRRQPTAGGVILTGEQARAVYMSKRRLDLATLSACFEDADESIDYAGKNLSK